MKCKENIILFVRAPSVEQTLTKADATLSQMFTVESRKGNRAKANDGGRRHGYKRAQRVRDREKQKQGTRETITPQQLCKVIHFKKPLLFFI